MTKKQSKDNDKKADKPPVPFMAYPGFDMMRDEMERMIRRFTGADRASGMGQVPALKDWMQMGADMPFAAMMNAPRSDLTETDSEYELSVELPGLDENDIELTLTDRSLVLKGEKKAEKETKEKDYHFSERSYGSVRRQFLLPDNVDRDAMKADFAKGVLKVTLPKTKEAKAKSRRIEVNPG